MNKYEGAYLMMMWISLKLSIDGYNEEVIKMNDNLAILGELVNKVTPKEPLFYSNDQGKDFWYCPTCQGHLANDTEEYLCGNYCPRCGQALKWDEEEEE